MSNSTKRSMTVGVTDNTGKWHTDVAVPAEGIVSVLVPENGGLTGIDAPVAEGQKGRYYNLNGVRIDKPLGRMPYIKNGRTHIGE